MDVYVYALRVDFETEVGERMTTFGEEIGISLFDCFAHVRGFYQAVVDEEEEHGLLDVVVGIRGPSCGLEAPFCVR